MKTYYQILNIKENASQKEIKKAYRQLSKIYHPDKSSGSSNKFIEIKEAYDVLKNPSLKKDYDFKLKEQKISNTNKLGGIEKVVLEEIPGKIIHTKIVVAKSIKPVVIKTTIKIYSQRGNMYDQNK